ncbi:MAG: hypothetical protein AAGG48_00185 [Planctomycetota bacterium]
MNEASLQHVFALNREIAALAETGLPLDIGLRGNEELAPKLENINACLAERVSRGESIEQAIRNAVELPARYRTGLWAWIHHSDPTIALDSFARPAETQRDFGRYLGRVFFYPLLLLCLAYLGLLVLCLYTAPTMESIFVSLFGTSEPIRWLQRAQTSTSIWIPLFPITMLVVFIVWWLARRRSSWSWVPGSHKYYQSVRNADLAQRLASLIESGRTEEEALAILAGASATESDYPSRIETLPPLLSWALSSKLDRRSLPGILQLVAESYRQSAERQRDFWRVVMPTIAGAVLGGCIVFFYGLMLFLPLIELLMTVASPSGVPQ